MNEGKYLYCVINEEQSRNFGPMGIGDRGDEVYTLGFRDLACVISSTPMTKFVISRKNLIAHEKVIEKIMGEYNAVLPVRFCTVATSSEEIRNLLMKNYQALKNSLRSMDNKIELGLKVFWQKMEDVFKDIASTKKIVRLKEKLIKSSISVNTNEKVSLGKKVKEILEKKREIEAEKILEVLRPKCIEFRRNKIIGDKMILNCAFLVDKSHARDFDDHVERLNKTSEDRLKFKYVGPIAPFNFVELNLKWGQQE
ncbi:MAG: GvpL/GvpF family gas vesicle protein [Atribacteria sp.]|nr:GvpL/GvpF family gas vesicle protein [Candidatus Atribacteria bacterium]MCG2762131.1 GvpL/GvpF family gas vesicle protein [Candidatus Atribacteria bacterium]